MSKDYYIYDLEVYPNIFLFCGKFRSLNNVQLFEISDRVNELQGLVSFLNDLRSSQFEMVGYNNINYDYYIIHELLTNPYSFTYQKAKEISDKIFNSQKGGRRLRYIPPWERLIPQIDIMKFLHFDNRMKAVSLKHLQFAMRSHSLEDLPFDIRELNDLEKDELKEYNIHDVTETEKFFTLNEHHINMRRKYLKDNILKGDVLNFSDVKIGVQYLLTKIGKEKCYNKGKAIQTIRSTVSYRSVILPSIFFKTEMFQEIHKWFMEQTYRVGVTAPKYSKKMGGVNFEFGIGGLHASVEKRIYKSNEDYEIIDIDVASMYPSVAIANNFAPEHLGKEFTKVYRQIKEDRKKYPKGTPENAALKLAGNGAYGNFNNIFSPLYDVKCMLSITLNGQLQLLQLAEMISLIPDVEIIQVNTDGITAYVKKDKKDLFDFWCTQWEEMTKLDLERVEYSRMFIRDVNNYIAEKTTGELKRKGTYWYPTNIKDYDGNWHKNFSNIASKKAAEKFMLNNWPLESTLRMLADPFDFMLSYKAKGSAKLFIADKPQLKTLRYYISKEGGTLRKVSKPKGEIGEFKRKAKITDSFYKKILSEVGKGTWDERIHTKNKSIYEMVETKLHLPHKVKQSNICSDFNWGDLDWDFYIKESEKLIIREN